MFRLSARNVAASAVALLGLGFAVVRMLAWRSFFWGVFALIVIPIALVAYWVVTFIQQDRHRGSPRCRSCWMKVTTQYATRAMGMTISANTPQKKLRQASIRTTAKPSPSSATALAATFRALSLNIAPLQLLERPPPTSLRRMPVAAVGRNDLRCHGGGGLLDARRPPPLGHREDVHVDTPAGLRLGGDQTVQPTGFLVAAALAVPPGDVAQPVPGAEAAVQVARGADIPDDTLGDECEHTRRPGEGELGLDPAERAQCPRRIPLLDGRHP